MLDKQDDKMMRPAKRVTRCFTKCDSCGATDYHRKPFICDKCWGVRQQRAAKIMQEFSTKGLIIIIAALFITACSTVPYTGSSVSRETITDRNGRIVGYVMDGKTVTDRSGRIVARVNR